MQTKLRKAQFQISKLGVLFVGLLFMTYSCDFGTEINYSYESAEDADESVSIWWNREGDCYIFIDDVELDYDKVAVLFPAEEIPIISYEDCAYFYLYDDSGVTIIDSTLYCNDVLDLTEDDPRILENDSLYIRVFKGSESLFNQTLFREKTEIDFMDRIPLPKLHG